MPTNDLFSAISDNDTERVQSLLAASPEIIDRLDDDYDDNHPLHVAIGGARSSDIRRQIASILIAAGADVNAVGDYGYTPLHLATKYSLHDVAEELLKAGASLAVSDGTETPLDMAARLDDHYLVGLYIKHNSPLSIVTSIRLNRSDFVRWMIARDDRCIRTINRSDKIVGDLASLGNIEMLALLATHGAAVDSPPGGRSPLLRAVESGSIDSVRILLEAKADPNGCRPPLGQESQFPAWISPLAKARQMGFKEAEDILLRFGSTS